MSGIPYATEKQALNTLLPSSDFRTTIDTTRYTKCVIVMDTSSALVMSAKNKDGVAIDFYATCHEYITRINEAPTVEAGFVAVYFYEDGTD